MTFRGHIERGVVILDDPANLPDGTAVEVRAIAAPPQAAASGRTWGEVFRDLRGSVQGLPADMAENHDHYIHGAPKGIDKR